MTPDTTTTPRPSHPPVRPGWPDEPTRSALQLITEALTELAGFEVASLSVTPDGEHLDVIVVSGDDGAREDMLGRRTRVERWHAEIERAEDWGRFKFVPAERIGSEDGDWGWVADRPAPEGDPAAWHPLDLLFAPLYDADGTLRGTLAIDQPRDGRRPDDERRLLLERFARQAERAVVGALERAALAEEVRWAQQVREVVRRSAEETSIEGALARIKETMVESFGLSTVWVRLPGRSAPAALHTAFDAPVLQDPVLARIAERGAQHAWRTQRASVISPEGCDNVPRPDDADLVLQRLHEAGLGSAALVPLAVGNRLIGSLTLVRPVGAGPWPPAMLDALMEAGRDLALVLLDAWALEREQRLVRDLRELEAYRSQLVAAVAAELAPAVDAIDARLSAVRVDDDAAPAITRGLTAMQRSADRMARLLADLRLLSSVSDPERPLAPAPVDLWGLAADVVEQHDVAARRRGVRLRVTGPREQPTADERGPDRPGPDRPGADESPRVVALGEREQLERVLTNLVSNAVKYSPDGGDVVVRLLPRGERVVVEVADQGIGISGEDQARLFTEFFRTGNPRALAQPGTGLGLVIVERIVRRHGGRVEVDSEPRRGATFRLDLPAQGDA